MNPQTPKNPEEELATPKTEKLPYEPPQANFIHLRIEERLLDCPIYDPQPCSPTFSW